MNITKARKVGAQPGIYTMQDVHDAYHRLYIHTARDTSDSDDDWAAAQNIVNYMGNMALRGKDTRS